MRVSIVYHPHFNPAWGPLGYAKEGDAGFDLIAALPGPRELKPGERTLIPSGVSMAIPEGYVLDVRPRSGLALKKGIAVLNSPGTVDAGYRAEIGIILINHSAETFVVEPGMRIAQGVVLAFETVEFDSVAELPPSSRGLGGFGSTGV